RFNVLIQGIVTPVFNFRAFAGVVAVAIGVRPESRHVAAGIGGVARTQRGFCESILAQIGFLTWLLILPSPFNVFVRNHVCSPESACSSLIRGNAGAWRLQAQTLMPSGDGFIRIAFEQFVALFGLDFNP